jgi:hypothetical protein
MFFKAMVQYELSKIVPFKSYSFLKFHLFTADG